MSSFRNSTTNFSNRNTSTKPNYANSNSTNERPNSSYTNTNSTGTDRPTQNNNDRPSSFYSTTERLANSYGTNNDRHANSYGHTDRIGNSYGGGSKTDGTSRLAGNTSYGNSSNSSGGDRQANSFGAAANHRNAIASPYSALPQPKDRILNSYGGDKSTPTRAPSNTNFTLSPLSPKGKEEPQPPTRKTYGSGVASIRDKYSTESAEARMKSPEPVQDKPKVSRFLHQKSQLVNPKSVIERVAFDLAKTENKFPEKKVKMVSRATSPSPPSNSVFLRQRRADLEKIVEIEVTRSKKYCATRSSEMQTDEHPPVPPPPPPTTVRTSSWNNRFSTTSPVSSYSPSSSPAPSRYSSNTPTRLSSGYSYARPSDLPIRSSSMKPSDFSKDNSPAPRSPRLTSYKSDSPTSPTSSKYTSYTPRNDNSPIDSKPRLAFSYTPRSSGDVSPKIPEPPPAPLRTVSIGVTTKPPQSPRSANGGNPKLVNIDSPEFREAHMLELSNSISKMNLDQDQNGFKKSTNEPSSSSEEEEEEEEETETSSSSTATKDPQMVTVPITLCLTIMVGYIYGGAILFSAWEDWDTLDGSYFCFISLSTIGFGDIVPGDKTTGKSQDSGVKSLELSFILCALYLMLGMALIAMCFNLMQEEVVHKMRTCSDVLRRIGRCRR
uniref:TWiK family of potassium channels protein 18 n=1 Tax=Cacopsylla melanoneura TaxID=428564 RepID=A0A8D8QFB3_9HEMI